MLNTDSPPCLSIGDISKKLIYCNTDENVADIFTKPLGKAMFEICRNQLGVVENSFLHLGGALEE